MEQVLAQTQAELEQEGWVFDAMEQPEPMIVVNGNNDYTGNLEAVIDAVRNDKPFEVKVWNQAGNTFYLCTQVYLASSTRISFYSTFKRGEVAAAIEVRINPETSSVEVLR